MSVRVVTLVRRLSTGDPRLKQLATQNLSKEAPAIPTAKPNEINEVKRFYRIRSYSNPQPAELSKVAFANSRENIRKSMTSSTSSDLSNTGMDAPKHTNRLAKEKSPYLLQHATNPVDWYPWGDEAFEKAKKEQKLIFLSVGYSTCHWCHVMERESFENESVAKVMNENFVNVKVDREERPDVDSVYMWFVQAISGRGGWPMTVILTPDLQPIAGGTYFPPEDKWGRPGLKTLLRSLVKKWAEDKDDVLSNASNIMNFLKQICESKKSGVDSLPPSDVWKKCVDKFTKSFDPEFGGFSGAPKFPQPCNFNFLFHMYARDKESEVGKKCLEMCLHTLRKMANGGIHDHIGGGFARYSVDERWHVPHFEKMLYDQAQLAIAFSDAYLASKDSFYADVLRDILQYVNRDLSHESGGFYSAEDADSLPTNQSKVKKEGAFYVWDHEEIVSLLGDESIEGISYADIFCHHFGIEFDGNIEPTSDPHGEMIEKNVPIVLGSLDETAVKFNLTTKATMEVLDRCKSILFEARSKRPKPHLDSKMICAWNGLMIAGYSKAGQSLGEKQYIDRAVSAANFIKKHLYNESEGTLLRACYRGEDGGVSQIANPIHGFLDDYAFLIKGLLDLYEASLNREWLEWANALQDKQDELFWDDNRNSYYATAVGDSSVLLRLVEETDGAEPSGNSVSANNLLRLGAHGGAEVRKAKAEKILKAFSHHLTSAPNALPDMLSALMAHNDCPTQVFIAGGRDDPRTQALLRAVRTRLLPGRVVAVAEPTRVTGNSGVSEILLSRIRPLGDRPAAYVCRHYACSLPVTEVEKLEELLDEKMT